MECEASLRRSDVFLPVHQSVANIQVKPIVEHILDSGVNLMRDKIVKRQKVQGNAFTKIVESSSRKPLSIIVLLIAAGLLAGFSGASGDGSAKELVPAGPSIGATINQRTIVPQPGSLEHRLSLQPEADRMRRRLGQRFLAPGGEVTTMVGVLTIGVQPEPVQIVRTRDDDGESLAIALGIVPVSRTWTAIEGARSGGNPATGTERSLIERLALDSPDQFVLAQTRGASYYTVARSAMPVEAGGSETYSGPVWDLVRIGEPSTQTSNRPLSLSRLYYINCSTGLIDKVASQEQSDTIVAEVSNWVNQGGEVAPLRIVWKRNEQVLMQLVVTTITHSAI